MAGAWVRAERGRFAPWLAGAMMAGAASFFVLRADPPWWAGAVGVAAAVAACALVWRRPARAAALVALAVALGFASGQAAVWRAAPVVGLPSRAVLLTAAVRGVDVLPDGRRLVLQDVRLGEDGPLRRTVRVRMKRGDGTEVAAGDRVELRAVLRAPAPPAYPGAWDLQRDEYFAGIAGGGTALGPVRVMEHAAPSGLAATVQSVRDAVARRAMAAIPGPAGTVAATLLTGSAAAIPQADRAAFRDSGLAHLLAVAGLHIGIIMGLVMGATRLGLAAWPTRRCIGRRSPSRPGRRWWRGRHTWCWRGGTCRPSARSRWRAW